MGLKSRSGALKPIKTEKTTRTAASHRGEEEEPLSPGGRMFHAPSLNLTIVAVMGFKTPLDPAVFKAGLCRTLLRHPRFSSNLVGDGRNGGNKRWVPTTVNLEKHVIVPHLDSNSSPENLVGDYITAATEVPLNLSRPLWEVHLLNIRTPDAESVAIFRIHHSLGDGASLMSVVLACARQSSDPQALPTIPCTKRRSSTSPGGVLCFLLMIWTTFVDLIVFLATIVFLKDSETPIKGRAGVELRSMRFVHRIVSLEEIKLVKNGLNATINDVLLGVTQSGLTRYLSRKPEFTNKESLSNLRLRATVMVNLRPAAGIQDLADMMDNGSKAKNWGNQIGYVILPFSIGLKNDPLEYVRSAKAVVDRKKLSLEALCSYSVASLVVKLFGAKVAAGLCRRVIANTTLAFSNIVGPQEEVDFYGHPVAYIAPSVYGHPHALTFHYQSHAEKMIISVTVDPDVISDPYQLCDDLEESLRSIKQAVIEKGLAKNPILYSDK